MKSFLKVKKCNKLTDFILFNSVAFSHQLIKIKYTLLKITTKATDPVKTHSKTKYLTKVKFMRSQ